MITFEKLFVLLDKRNISGYRLIKDKVIFARTLERIKAGESISIDTINKLCNYLNCKPMDIMTYTPDKVDPDNLDD